MPDNDRQKDRETGRQAGRQADIQTDRQTDRQTDSRQEYRQAGRQAGIQADRNTDRQEYRQAEIQTGRNAGRNTFIHIPVVVVPARVRCSKQKPKIKKHLLTFLSNEKPNGFGGFDGYLYSKNILKSVDRIQHLYSKYLYIYVMKKKKNSTPGTKII